MILIGLGANLPSTSGPPRATCEAALGRMEAEGLRILARSAWYESAPVPISDQPGFTNGVAHVASALPPVDLLRLLHKIEATFGRVRGRKNAARSLDLDLLAYGDLASTDPRSHLPHPRLHERAFVLWPLREIAPEWRHPVSGLTVQQLIDRLPPGEIARRLP